MVDTAENVLRKARRMSIIYGIVWFVDLLDASILNVALPSIAKFFNVQALSAEWAILGFLLALAISMPASIFLGGRIGLRRLAIIAQILYIISSLLCGLSRSLDQLVIFRILQGAAGGILIPVAMTVSIKSLPQEIRAKYFSAVNLVTLIAPALGPILAGYVTSTLGWPWLFYIKIPLSCLGLLLTFYWIEESRIDREKRFDVIGFTVLGIALTLFLISLSMLGEEGKSFALPLVLLGISLAAFWTFIAIEKRVSHPIVPLTIFKHSLFFLGNIIQVTANIIFLGSTFIIALYLQEGLKFGIVKTGWLLSPITLGMYAALPIVSRYYNRIGPKPFLIPGLLILSGSMFALCFITPKTYFVWIGLIIFFQGFASVIVQTPNGVAIFCQLKQSELPTASGLFPLFKQLSASIGVALSTLTVTLGLFFYNIQNMTAATTGELQPLFRNALIILGLFPLISLLLLRYYDNDIALSYVKP